jgi:MFS family permease
MASNVPIDASVFDRARAATRRTFRAIQVRNFRLYFIGQLISVSGTWLQSVAQAWLVLELTHSAILLSLAVAVPFVPMLLAGPWGGLIVDRSSKRQLLLITQGSSALLALGLGLLVALGSVKVWEVFAFGLATGIVNLFDNPARQTFVQELVGHELLANAVSLNSILFNFGRVLGPAMAGILIGTVGISTCFLVNAGTFVAVIIALLMMDPAELSPMRRAGREKGQLREGFRYAFHQRTIRNVLLTVGVVGLLAFNFTVTLPLLAKDVFHGTATTYGMLAAAMGVGAVVGGIYTAYRDGPSRRFFIFVTAVFGVLLLVVGAAPTSLVAMVALVFTGAASIAFLATANTAVQLACDEEMRGRVMSLYSIGFMGTTPIGAPIVGLICALSSARVGLWVGGVATLFAALVVWRSTH